MVARIVAGSHFFMIATAGDKIIGMGRAISDGVSDAYIQDVVVEQAFRGNRIGSALVGRLVDALKRDGIEWIGLIAEKGSRKFYDSLGFGPMAGAVPMLKKAPWNSNS